jgi:hypothetical protein
MADEELPNEDVQLGDLLEQAITDRLIDVNTSFLARVESFDASSQTLDATPMQYRALPDGSGNWIPEALPKLGNVPVIFPRCGEFFISFPIKKGDFVVILCAQRNLSVWRSTGNAGDPGDLGMHTLDGAMAIPGLFPDNGKLSNVSTDDMVLGSDTQGTSRIELKASGAGIHLGAGATKGVVRTGDDLSASSALISWAAAVEAGVAAGGGGTISPTFASASGVAGGLGTAHGHSNKIKAVD